MNDGRFDLNLIRVLLAVAKHRSVTAAGMELGLTQSTVSHSLARLRELCNDPLFVRTSGGMLPTPSAHAMLEPLEAALAMMRASILGSSEFVPSTTTRCFNLLLSDIGQLIYLPIISDHLTRNAPRLSLKVLHLRIDAYRDALINGEADFAIGHLPGLQGGFRQISLFQDPYVCMLRADHPHIHESISMAQYLDALHIVVEPPGRGPGPVEQALAGSKVRRKVALSLPHFFAAPLILRKTNYLLTAPNFARFALSDLHNIRAVSLPFRVKRLSIKVLWHERMHRDPGHRWLRTAIAELLPRSIAKLTS
ncbi:MAG: LysR family transcriptional regulator [Variovorax sp.]